MGSVVAVLVASWILAQVLAEASLGRPSSTAGLGFVFGPIYGLVCGGVAFVIGLALRWFARRAGVASRQMPSWFLLAIVGTLVASVAAMVVSARSQIVVQEAVRQPRVIVDSARFVKTATPGRELMRAEAPLFYSLIPATTVPSIDWNGHLVTLEAPDERVVVLNSAGQQVASTDLHEFDYIGTIHAVPVCADAAGSRALAVLVTLRPTSHRSMLIVYGADGSVLYQEHLERTGAADKPMYVATRDGAEVLVVEHGTVSAWTCADR
jgi:hypothetical protein